MKNMLSIVEDFLRRNKKGATFNQIFDYVKDEMKQTWKELFPTKLLKQIEDEKIGELYTLLSIDGRFIRNKDHLWFLMEALSFEEAKQMRSNIGDEEEIVEEE